MNDDDDVIIDISLNNQVDIAYLQYKNHYINELGNKFKHEYESKLVSNKLNRINATILVISAIITLLGALKLIIVGSSTEGFSKYNWFDISVLVLSTITTIISSVKQSKGWENEPSKHKDSAKTSEDILNSILRIFTPFNLTNINLTKNREDIESRVGAQANAPDISDETEQWFERTKSHNSEYISRIEMFNRIDNNKTNKLIVKGGNKEEKTTSTNDNEIKIIDITNISYEDSSSSPTETSLESELKKLRGRV